MGPVTPETPEVRCHLDELLLQREITLTQLSERVGLSVVNLSVLKNNRAKAVRFSTLVLICQALNCDIGDLFSLRTVRPEQESREGPLQ